ncbi:MAG: flippase [Pedosphaera sp.]|nr:flippase [Pedosphaera sp.]
MSDFRHIIRGSTYLAVGAQVGRMVNFIQVLLLTNYLGPTEFGIWSLIQALPAMLIVMTDLGLNSVMLRAIARNKAQEQEVIQGVLSLKCFLAPVYVLAVYLIARNSGHDRHVVHLATLSSLAMVAGLCGETIIAAWRAHERFGLETKITLAKDVTSSLLLIGVTLFGFGLKGLVWANVGHSLLVSVLLLRWYLKQKPVLWVISPIGDYFRQIRAAVPFAVYGLLNPLSTQLALVMLGSMSGLTAVGIYNIALRIIVFLYFIPNALNRTLLPRLSAQFAAVRQEAYRDTIGKALQLVLVIALPVAVGLSLTAHDFVALLFPSEFAAAGHVLVLLALSVPCFYIRVVVRAAVYAAGREKAALVVTATTTALNLVLNWFLIPRFGYDGAAMTTLIAEALQTGAFCCLMGRDISFKGARGFLMKIVLASSVMGAAVWSTQGVPLVVRVSLGAAVYLAALFILRVVTSTMIRSYWIGEDDVTRMPSAR